MSALIALLMAAGRLADSKPVSTPTTHQSSWFARPRLFTDPGDTALAPAESPPAAVLAAEAAGSAPAPGQMAVCGHGLMDAAALEGDQPPPWRAEWLAAATALKLRVGQHLRASADDQDRVVAALLSGDTDAAARIAYRSNDAAAYGMAFLRCTDGAGACRLLSVGRWAQLDAGNAAPWLVMATAAQQRGDQAGLAEGLHRASLAISMEVGFGQMAGRVIAALPLVAADSSVPVEASSATLLIDATGQDAARVIPTYGAIGRGCSIEALKDSNRFQLCQAVGRMLLKRGRTLMDIGIGLRLAERTGIPSAEMPITRGDLDAGMKWITEVQAGPADQMLSCEGLDRPRHYFTAVAQWGEWGAIQQGMQANRASAATVTKP